MGNNCGGIRQPCLSDTDPRYDPNSNFDIVDQNSLWSKQAGLWEYTGTTYHANGTVQELHNININETPNNNLPQVVSNVNRKLFANFTIHDGTRSTYSTLNVFGPASSPPLSYGYAFASSTYGTSTFELDGRLLTSPSQFVLNDGNDEWQDGDRGTTYVVSDEATHSSTISKDLQQKSSVTYTCLNEECSKMSLIQQIYNNDNGNENGDLDSFEVLLGEKITNINDFNNRVQNAMTEYNVHPSVQSHTTILSNPHNPPTEKWWCETDPTCATSPYVNPSTALRLGAMSGFIIGFIALGILIFYFLYKISSKKRDRRIQQAFANRIAQTINVRASAEMISPTTLQNEFRTIDESGDGFLQKDELWNFLQTSDNYVGTLTKSDFDCLWICMDLDVSGKVDFLEFCGFLKKCHQEYDGVRNDQSVIGRRASQILTNKPKGLEKFVQDRLGDI